LAGLLLMVVATLGPWFVDTHPATAETCSPPLVWVGDDYCACLISLASTLAQAANLGQSAPLYFVLCLPAALPFITTLLLLFGGAHRGVWVAHLAAWALAGVYALIWFAGMWYLYRGIWLWGAGLGLVVAAAMVAGEVVAAKGNRREAMGVEASNKRQPGP
jgi:hypothetical protein